MTQRHLIVMAMRHFLLNVKKAKVRIHQHFKSRSQRAMGVFAKATEKVSTDQLEKFYLPQIPIFSVVINHVKM